MLNVYRINICSKCRKPIAQDKNLYFYNDNVFCTEKCRANPIDKKKFNPKNRDYCNLSSFNFNLILKYLPTFCK